MGPYSLFAVFLTIWGIFCAEIRICGRRWTSFVCFFLMMVMLGLGTKVFIPSNTTNRLFLYDFNAGFEFVGMHLRFQHGRNACIKRSCSVFLFI